MKSEKKSVISEKQRIVTPEFRVSFPHIFKAHAFKNEDPKFSLVMLFKKTTDISKLKIAIKHAKIGKWGAEGNWPDDLHNPIRDGDGPKLRKRNGYKGCWEIKASSNGEYKPELVGTDGEPIVTASDFYPGCYARAEIFANAWEFGDKTGVSFILNSVIKMRDGKPLSSRKPAKEVFAGLLSEGEEGGEESEEEEEEPEEQEDF